MWSQQARGVGPKPDAGFGPTSVGRPLIHPPRGSVAHAHRPKPSGADRATNPSRPGRNLGPGVSSAASLGRASPNLGPEAPLGCGPANASVGGREGLAATSPKWSTKPSPIRHRASAKSSGHDGPKRVEPCPNGSLSGRAVNGGGRGQGPVPHLSWAWAVATQSGPVPWGRRRKGQRWIKRWGAHSPGPRRHHRQKSGFPFGAPGIGGHADRPG